MSTPCLTDSLFDIIVIYRLLIMATRKLELLSLSANIRDWFERFDFYVLANNLATVVNEGATQEVQNAAALKT